MNSGRRRLLAAMLVCALPIGTAIAAGDRGRTQPQRVSGSPLSKGPRQAVAPPPAVQPVALAKTAITVEFVSGKVAARATQQDKWTPVRTRDQFTQGVEFMIGLKSAVRVRVGASQLFTFDQAGKVKVALAANDGRADITRIFVDQGRVNFDVTRTRYANDVVIEAPDMTLAVVGTKGGMQVTPGHATLGYGAVDNTGLIRITLPDQRSVPLRFNQRTDTIAADPAHAREGDAVIFTPAETAVEKEEQAASKRLAGTAEVQSLDLGNLVLPPTLGDDMKTKDALSKLRDRQGP
jgi:hypothetical protein